MREPRRAAPLRLLPHRGELSVSDIKALIGRPPLPPRDSRILNGEHVPVHEKIFSIFDRKHTDLIKRGKPQRPVEFGHKVFWLRRWGSSPTTGCSTAIPSTRVRSRPPCSSTRPSSATRPRSTRPIAASHAGQRGRSDRPRACARSVPRSAAERGNRGTHSLLIAGPSNGGSGSAWHLLEGPARCSCADAPWAPLPLTGRDRFEVFRGRRRPGELPPAYRRARAWTHGHRPTPRRVAVARPAAPRPAICSLAPRPPRGRDDRTSHRGVALRHLNCLTARSVATTSRPSRYTSTCSLINTATPEFRDRN